MDTCYEIGEVEVRAGTKVELRDGARAWGWGEVTMLLPAGQVEIQRLDDIDERYVVDARGDGVEVYVDDWSPECQRLIAEQFRRTTEPAAADRAAVDHYDLAGFGEVRVGTKVEVWDGTEGDEGRDWGEVTMLLTERRVQLHWYAEGDRFIDDIAELGDLFVDDWSGEVYDILRRRAREQAHGRA